MNKKTTTEKHETKIKDFAEMSDMKNMEDMFDETERMIDEGDIPELDDFYQYCDQEKLDRFNKLKNACKTMSDASRYHDFVYEKSFDPNNTAPTGSVCILVKLPVFYSPEQYKPLMRIANMADSLAVCYIRDNVMRISFSITYVFHN